MDSIVHDARALTLDEEKGAAIVLPRNTVLADPVPRWSLLGKFVTERAIRVGDMQNVLADVWQPRLGVCAEALGPNLFRFDFHHPWERERVFTGGPYTFEQQLLCFHKMDGDVVTGNETFSHADFWVHVYEVPYGFMSEHIAVLIGDFVGKFVESDANNFNGPRRAFLRIRVSMDVTKPLKRKMQLGFDEKNMFWVFFKYERLPTFCFHCGLIGHADKFCPKLLDHPDPAKADKPYSPSLRAPPRRSPPKPQSRYLLPGPPQQQFRFPQPEQIISGKSHSDSELLGDKQKSVSAAVLRIENGSESSSKAAPVSGITIPIVKRRREEILSGDKELEEGEFGLTDMDSDDIVGTGPKNGIPAGSVTQTRQAS